ncbi:hypothetical protein ACIQXD_11065 [Streptomyces uncialis]|uniref:Rv1733c family protein n=1 Tax=Streptomyces uncialis TaxID=1048205 RepID=UPI0037FECE43
MRAMVGVWRWRHNPLRRRTDAVEAWLALGALLLTLCAAPVAGVLAGAAAERSLTQSVREQQRERYRTTATVLRVTPGRAVLPEDDEDGRVTARWTGPDGTPRTGPVASGLDVPRAGSRFPVWTDPRGRITAPPMTPDAVTVHAVLAGGWTVAVLAALVDVVRRLAVGELTRRRYRRLDQAWERAGPDWGRTGTGR